MLKFQDKKDNYSIILSCSLIFGHDLSLYNVYVTLSLLINHELSLLLYTKLHKFYFRLVHDLSTQISLSYKSEVSVTVLNHESDIIIPTCIRQTFPLSYTCMLYTIAFR